MSSLCAAAALVGAGPVLARVRMAGGVTRFDVDDGRQATVMADVGEGHDCRVLLR